MLVVARYNKIYPMPGPQCSAIVPVVWRLCWLAYLCLRMMTIVWPGQWPIKIWHKLSDWANEENVVVDALIQIHIAQESSKHGFYIDELLNLLRTGAHLEWSGIRIRGLMGMATFTNDVSIIKSESAFLRTSFEQLKNEFYKNEYFTELSMGMSSDYKLALENGASLIRVGTTIFGQRNYAT